MQVLGALGGVALVALFCEIVIHGLANTLDRIALALHRAAARLRELQRARTAHLSQAWVMTLERDLAPPMRAEDRMYEDR